MLPQILNTLTWWQWLILAAVPPAIIALYFLKLKRHPLEVPSTYLWHKSIEDLHVNTIWQRLRRNLLLFLQLLLLLLAALALLRPGWHGDALPGDRFIFLVDNSASMQATDMGSSRLEAAKERVHEMIDKMKSGDAAMIVSFADTAQVEQMFSDNHRQLHRELDDIEPTQRRTSIEEALKVASARANPGRAAYEQSDVSVAEAMPATMYVVSDGRFAPVPGFDPGNLDPVYVPVGNPMVENVGIVRFSVRRHETRPDELAAFARLVNYGSTEAEASVDLRLNETLLDADRYRIPPGESQRVVIPVGVIDSGVLHLKITTADDFALDNEAWVVVSVPRRAKVLVVTEGNEPLEAALTTESAAAVADVTFVEPDFTKTDDYRRQTSLGAYDLVIFDRCHPEALPPANTFFIGALPPGEEWKAGEEVTMPAIIDTDPSHPLMQWVAMGDVEVYWGNPLEVPAGGSVLVDTHLGPVLVIAPREGFEDAVLGFPLIGRREDENGKSVQAIGTTWFVRTSFPVFVLNLLEYLGGGRKGMDAEGVQPGTTIQLESPVPNKPLEVRTPSGRRITLREARQGKFDFAATWELGVYEASAEGRIVRRFSVNLFDPAESDVVPATEVSLPVAVKAQSYASQPTRRELWKLLLLLGLGVLCFEWYVYNRRVYM